jgi:hypothetical protein
MGDSKRPGWTGALRCYPSHVLNPREGKRRQSMENVVRERRDIPELSDAQWEAHLQAQRGAPKCAPNAKCAECAGQGTRFSEKGVEYCGCRYPPEPVWLARNGKKVPPFLATDPDCLFCKGEGTIITTAGLTVCPCRYHGPGERVVTGS